MTALPDDHLPRPRNAGATSVWADRVGHRQLIGRNQRGVEIPIGEGEGRITPGELLKIALLGCAGMSVDVNVGRRLGDDFPMRLWAHDASDAQENRYTQIGEEVQLDLSDLSAEQIASVRTVFGRAVAAGCTVERTIVPGVPVTHTFLGEDGGPLDGEEPSAASGTDASVDNGQEQR